MKKIFSKITYILPFMVMAACTNLEVEETDSVFIDDEGGTFTGVNAEATLSSAYGDLRGFADQANLYALLEVTSDELLVPTRGTDWGDNGIWRTLHQHTWDASHQHILTTWNNLNANVFKLNQIIAPESEASNQELAEAKFLRAYNMFLILDLYGQIPFRGVNDGVEVDPLVMSSQEAFDYIMKDINEALPDLPATGPGAETLKASKASANFLKAKMYLNKHIYIGGEAQAADMTEVVEAVDAIAADGFALHNGYFEIFEEAAESETIFWTDAEYGNRIWIGLHYNQQVPDNTGGGWNGFSTTADFYALFEGNPDSNEPGNNQEERRGFVPDNMIGYGFLVGQQYGPDGPLTDRAGNPLVFTKDFPGLTGNNERHGIRIIKYHPSNGAFGGHYILFRYADAHLMKAEAVARGGSAGQTATQLVNELRVIRDAEPLGDVPLQNILEERGRELYIEGWRRNDQIRFGTFTQKWEMKDSEEAHRILFPIPATALTSNPNLIQNQGY